MSDFARDWTEEQLKALEQNLAVEYTLAAKEMRKKSKDFLRDFEKEKAERIKALDGSEYMREEYEAWLEEQTVKAQWFEDMVAVFAKELANTDAKAVAMLNDYLPGIYAENANMAAYTVDSSIGLNTDFTLEDQDTVRFLMTESPDLDNLLTKTINPAKENRWCSQKARSALTQGIIQGESITQIASRLNSVFAMGERSAVMAARTATTGAENAGRLSSYERAKDIGINLKQEWLAALDSRTRDSHRMLDGTQVEVGETFKAEMGELRFPGDPQGHPSEVCNCRCTLVAAIDGIDQSNAERWSNLPKDMKYENWKAEASGRIEYRKKRRDEKLLDEAVASAIKDAKMAEVGVSADLTEIASELGIEFAGFEYRFKSEGSLKRKVLTEARQYGPNITDIQYSDVVGDIHDILRYTYLIDGSNFKDDYDTAIAQLERNGYRIVKVKNTMASLNGGYRGVNTLIMTPDGYVFELQFHTPESFDTKENKTHKWYEIERVAEPGSKEQIEAHNIQKELFLAIPMPNGAELIPSIDNRPKTNTRQTRLITEGIASYEPENEIDGGFTVELATSRSYRLGNDCGYAVGGFGTEAIIPESVYKDPEKLQQALNDYIIENREALSEEGACLGGWIPSSGEHRGELFLDVSKVTDDEREAAMYAIERGEDSITDFENVDWPSTESLAKKYGMEDEYETARKRKKEERGE